MKNETIINLLGRALKVKYSKSAVVQISNLNKEIYLEMELHFSCMVKKRVSQIENRNDAYAVKLNKYILLSFKPIMTNVCAPKDVNIHNHESIKVFNIDKPERFVPDWLYIDYKDGAWGGEFSYEKSNKLTRAV